nr:reverse transcriptase domain-containing protein [Tanacetum cinerariifolium]
MPPKMMKRKVVKIMNGDPLVPDLQTMEELCQPTLNGQGGQIALIAIQATNLRLKNDMIQQVQNSCQFYRLSGDDANKCILEEEKKIEEAQAANARFWKIPACYDDDDDYNFAVTPKLDEFIKSSVESLIPIPSESEGIPDNMCDVPFHDISPPLDVSKDQFEDVFYSNDEFSLIDDDSFSIDNIDYVEASPLDPELVSSEVMEIVIPEVGGIDNDILLTIKDDILHEKLLNVNLLIAKIKALNDNPTPSSDFKTKSSSTSFNSLLEETNTFNNTLPELEISALMWKKLVVAVPLLVLIFLFQNMKLSMTIILSLEKSAKNGLINQTPYISLYTRDARVYKKT